MPAMIRDQANKPGRVKAASGAAKSGAAKAGVTKAGAAKSGTAKGAAKLGSAKEAGKAGGRLGKGVIAVAPPSFRRERALLKQGIWPVAGCDEAGRGPLAGPVVAAAVILDPDRIPKGLDDSKRLSAEQREALFDKICKTSAFAVAVASPARIDRDNILRASLWALARAVKALPEAPRHVFVDGRDRIDVDCGCEAVIGGDGLVMSIAAASIVAKVTRDRLMCALAQDCPGYGFEQHKGYGVPEHLAALDRLGPSVHHRSLFAPVVAARRKHQPWTEVPEPDLFAEVSVVTSTEISLEA
ncbi:ribonuclease HII [Bradyrhizobium sp. 83002]|uniref:ribonuclease HII n=1 Tax=Bradyrhizobium aeschynomenes TaxID=2734909 RepID=UPI001554973D|nr:ribonuclease HII [Bradyrhizobium aeschynomenes]NPU09812.1 ribonuclease HII [Bradyrhizobium aeschynomenes]